MLHEQQHQWQFEILKDWSLFLSAAMKMIVSCGGKAQYSNAAEQSIK